MSSEKSPMRRFVESKGWGGKSAIAGKVAFEAAEEMPDGWPVYIGAEELEAMGIKESTSKPALAIKIRETIGKLNEEEAVPENLFDKRILNQQQFIEGLRSLLLWMGENTKRRVKKPKTSAEKTRELCARLGIKPEDEIREFARAAE